MRTLLSPARTGRAAATAVIATLLWGCGDNGSGPASEDDGTVSGAPADDAIPTPAADGTADPPRRLDGRDEALADPTVNAASTPLRRLLPADYADGRSAMAGHARPSPRAIGNALASLPERTPSAPAPTNLLWQWGQFLDHDISLTDAMTPREPAPIAVPAGDAVHDPLARGRATLDFERSRHVSDDGGQRQQLNQVTAWIDASMVYGSDAVRAAALRAGDGSGRLRTSAGEALPFNVAGLPNDGGRRAELHLAGDLRANEQPGLLALHTLFVREHNRLVERLAERHPRLGGEALYRRARRLVAAQVQAVTYGEYLPVLLGDGALAPYAGYDPDVDARLANVFSTALYRFGHSAVGESIARLEADGEPSAAGPLPLSEGFFAPRALVDGGGVEPVLRGLALTAARPIDLVVTASLRDLPFGAPGDGGTDLVAMNIQRGRDHGLPGYNAVRLGYGLAPATGFADTTFDAPTRQTLEALYGGVDEVDVWVGALAEARFRGELGELSWHAFVAQFEALRDGDRHWHERTLSADERAEMAPLAEIVRRNTAIGAEFPDRPFVGGE